MSKVFVTDDSMFQRLVLCNIAKEAGWETAEAVNGKACVDSIKEVNPDLLFLDLNMPEMTGFDVLVAVRGMGITIPIIVITADIQATTREKCLEMGATDIMYKPVDTQIAHGYLERFSVV